jgi:hypothetical protein
MKALIFKTTRQKLDDSIIDKYGLEINNKNTIINDEDDPSINLYYYEKTYYPINIGCLEMDLIKLLLDFNRVLLDKDYEKDWLTIQIVDDYLG